MNDQIVKPICLLVTAHTRDFPSSKYPFVDLVLAMNWNGTVYALSTSLEPNFILGWTWYCTQENAKL